MRINTDKQDYRPGEKVAITASDVPGADTIHPGSDCGRDGIKGTADDIAYRAWTVADGGRDDTSAASGTVGTSWTVPGTAIDSILELTASTAGTDGVIGTADDVVATTVFADARPGGTTGGTVSIKLDQWADGPVSQGDADGNGGTQEVFVNGNLNATKAHYNEGDAIPYRAILDDFDTRSDLWPGHPVGHGGFRCLCAGLPDGI